MEDTFRILCTLCIIFLQFPLYYLTPVKPISYTDVITNDASLCDDRIKDFLRNSEYTKNCTRMNYPRDIDELAIEDESIETFLCLGMHDTIYKACRYVNNKTWNNTFNEKEDLDLSIGKLSKVKTPEEFCQNLSGFSPMYNKTRPALSKLVKLLNDLKKCYKICFNIGDRLNPLCAVLAWINQIDETVKKNVITMEHNKLKDRIINGSDNPKDHESHLEQVNTNHNEQSTITENPESSKNKEKDTSEKQSKQTLKVNNKDPTSVDKPINNAQHSSQANTAHSQQTDFRANDSTPSKSVINAATPQTGKSNHGNLSDNSPLEAHIDSEKIDSTVTNAKDLHSTKDKGDNAIKSNKDKTGAISTSSSIEDVKSTTLSENTQDNNDEDNIVNNPNPDDFSRIDDDQLRSGVIDSLGQPNDADNRNENIPATSGRKEMENYSITKDDEESHFFTYFAIISFSFIAGYIGYHNKQKILAIVLEGRRSKNNRGRRRPSTANYRKLDCTLEEAVTSQCNANVTHVIY